MVKELCVSSLLHFVDVHIWPLGKMSDVLYGEYSKVAAANKCSISVDFRKIQGEFQVKPRLIFI